MPVTSALVTPQILAAAPGLSGPVWYNLAGGVGLAIEQWVAVGGITLTGVSTGTAGVGTVVGTSFFVAPQPLPVNVAMAGSSVLGPVGVRLASALGVGVANGLSVSARYAGVSIGVGTGTDVSKVVYADRTSLIGILTATFAASSISGPVGLQLAAAIGNGIADLALTGTGLGVVTGLPSPSGAVAASNSKVV
jgi:hypothetical protein